MTSWERFRHDNLVWAEAESAKESTGAMLTLDQWHRQIVVMRLIAFQGSTSKTAKSLKKSTRWVQMRLKEWREKS